MAAMITTCPGCGTSFRVTAGQLQARQGLVRCGRCAQVFNGFESLATGAAELGEEAADAVAAPAPAVAEPEREPAVFRRAPHGPAAQPVAVEPEAPPAAPAEPAPEQPPAAPAEEAAPAGFEMEPLAEAPAAAEAPATSLEAPRPRISIPIPGTELEEPAPRRFGWVWALLALPLAALLAGQATYRFRTEAAVLYPPARPWLEQLCQMLDCRVGLPRRPEYLDIAGSDLRAAEREPSRIAFEATLRNRAAFAQDYPALELTLTDGRDQPVARRVFGPADYLGAATRSEAGIGAGAELTLHLDLDIGDIRATGYRVYLFYPPARG